MRKFITAIAFMLATASGAQAALIGSATTVSGGGGAAIYSEGPASIGYYLPGVEQPQTFIGGLVGEGTTVFELTSGSDFDFAVGLLTNGVNDRMQFRSGGGAFGQVESYWFFDDFTGASGIDFQGFTISRLVLTVIASFVSPGSDPNNDGIWTEESYSLRLDVYDDSVSDVPLPAATPLFAAALMGGAGFLRRKRKAA
ncbi:hypothetical protein ACFOOP_16635 [Marinicaulis aureus]|uniref:VPLPA-CTERM sorting domain-containing protein n=1 Tax=Hyphococcus aureus TaxID=2666033 RepID=A0ABW1KWK4_9PROT